jgi:hypothetical protein
VIPAAALLRGEPAGRPAHDAKSDEADAHEKRSSVRCPCAVVASLARRRGAMGGPTGRLSPEQCCGGDHVAAKSQDPDHSIGDI